MALRGSRIKNFVDLWCIGALGDLEFCASSTSSQKSNIGWPQQPPTEKLLRFNLTFLDSTKKIVFQNIKNNIKINWNQEPGWLWTSEVLSSDFVGLRYICSLIDLSSLSSLWNLTGLNSLYSPISSKIFLILMIRSSLTPKWPIQVPFL